LVVTTPTFRRDEQPKIEEYDYIEFCRVFDSILLFNTNPEKEKIRTVGFEISFLYGFRKSHPYRKEAESLKKAYIEYCHKI
jgi:hypothetical protein